MPYPPPRPFHTCKCQTTHPFLISPPPPIFLPRSDLLPSMQKIHLKTPISSKTSSPLPLPQISQGPQCRKPQFLHRPPPKRQHGPYARCHPLVLRLTHNSQTPLLPTPFQRTDMTACHHSPPPPPPPPPQVCLLTNICHTPSLTRLRLPATHPLNTQCSAPAF